MIAYIDCSSGVSGDKLLGAFLDIGEASGAFTIEDLRIVAAEVAPEAVVDVERVVSHGIAAVGIRVRARTEAHARSWHDITEQLTTAELPDHVRATALLSFEELAIAESQVHGVNLQDVHFHEVGAIDSLVDIVGVCAAVHALDLEGIIASTVAIGSGTVETEHGTLPVPAPATALLLLGMPIEGGPVPGELTTPTGAALLRGLGASFGPVPPMRLARVGTGAGTRDIGRPNICRVVLGEESIQAPSRESVVLLETNIDHVSAEELAFAAEELLEEGALDVWQTPIVMKKGRSAVTLSVLADESDADRLAERPIALTGSLGVRRLATERYVAGRDVSVIESAWGPVRVKVGGGRVRPEHDDVARIAREHALPYRQVADEIARLASERTPE